MDPTTNNEATSERRKPTDVPCDLVPLYRKDPNFMSFTMHGGDMSLTDDELGELDIQVASSCGCGGTSLYLRVQINRGDSWQFVVRAEDLVDVAIADIKKRLADGLPCPRPGMDANGVAIPNYHDYRAAREQARRQELVESMPAVEQETASVEPTPVETSFEADYEAKEAEAQEARLREMGYGIGVDPDMLRQINITRGAMFMREPCPYREPNEQAQASHAWIAPDGRIWNCERCEHGVLGDSIAQHLYGEDADSKTLEERHWIKIGNNDFGIGRWFVMPASYLTPITKAQQNAVLSIIKAFLDEGKPTIALEISSSFRELLEEQSQL